MNMSVDLGAFDAKKGKKEKPDDSSG